MKYEVGSRIVFNGQPGVVVSENAPHVNIKLDEGERILQVIPEYLEPPIPSYGRKM